MLRLMGIGILFIGIVYTGFELSASLNRVIKLLRAVSSFLRYAVSQIENCNAGYREIYNSFPENPSYPDFFIPAIKSGGLIAVLEYKNIRAQLPEAAVCAIETFALSAGKSGREGQLSEIKVCNETVTAILKQLTKEFPQKSKMYISLAVSFGLMLGILLI